MIQLPFLQLTSRKFIRKLTMDIEEFIKNIDDSQLDKEVQQKHKYISDQKLKLTEEVDQKIFTIVLVKKRKLEYTAYGQAQEKLKKFLISAKNLINIYFDLLQDQETILLSNFSDIQNLVEKIRFCLFRSVHNMNRMLIKESESTDSQKKTVAVCEEDRKEAGCKRNKRKKGKNLKMTIQQTGCMYKWVLQNFQNPYPSQQQKQKLSADSKISITKVNYWFINIRERTIKKFMSPQNSTINPRKKNDKELQKKHDLSNQHQSEMQGSPQQSQNP